MPDLKPGSVFTRIDMAQNLSAHTPIGIAAKWEHCFHNRKNANVEPDK
ncbi:MAG: hypothetical protein ACRC56_05580 [Bosea sp. (in: a-proteobacteria)]